MELPENAQRSHVNERGKKSTYEGNAFEDNISVVTCPIDSPNTLVKLHNEAQVKIWLKDIIPSFRQSGGAISAGDCFFHSIADCLNQRSGKEEYSIQSLRIFCDEYVKDPKNSWVKAENIKDREDHNNYLVRIRFTAEELLNKERAGQKLGLATWGRPKIEGRIFCEQYNVKIHVIQIQEDGAIHRYLVDRNGETNDYNPDIDYHDLNILHIINYHTHFVPLLNSNFYIPEGQRVLLRKFTSNVDDLPITTNERQTINATPFAAKNMHVKEEIMELPENAQRFYAKEKEKISPNKATSSEVVASAEPWIIDSPNSLVKLHNEGQVKLWLKHIIPPYRQPGGAISAGDCFFHSIADCLNQRSGKEEYSIQSLRIFCDEYVKDPKNSWVKAENIIDREDHNSYLVRIRFTAEELLVKERAGLKLGLATWGRPKIEGRIFCEQYGVRIHVIQIQEDGAIHRYLVDRNGETNDYNPNIDYQDLKILHLINYDNHFVPLLNSNFYIPDGQRALLRKFTSNVDDLPITTNERQTINANPIAAKNIHAEQVSLRSQNTIIASRIFYYLRIKNLIRLSRVSKQWFLLVQPFINFPELFHEISTRAAFNSLNSLNFEDKKYSYQSLNQKIIQLTNYFISFANKRKLPKESKIAMFLEPSDAAVITMLAIMRAGLVYVPLNTDPDIAPEKLIKITEECKPVLLVTTTNTQQHPLIRHLSSKQTPLLQLDKDMSLNEQPSNPPIVNIRPNDAAYILYTSGSTGSSKGVLVEHEGLYNRFLSHKKLLNIKATDRIALFAAVGFDAHIMEIMMALLSGASLYIVQNHIRLDTLKLGEFYKNNDITIAIFTPSMLRILDPKDFTKMRVIISTGERIDEKTFDRWYWLDNAKTKSRQFINGYGPVEATICTTLGDCTPATGLHIGNAIDGVETFLLEENPENPLAPKKVNQGARGELYISGIGLAREYYGQDSKIIELNKKKFLTILHPDDHDKNKKDQRYIRVYRTADAMQELNGKLEFLERLDRLVKIYGKLVEPAEIDDILKKATYIEDAYVDIYINDSGHPIITAYLILKDPQLKPNLTELYHSVANSLNKTMCPSKWAIITKEQLKDSLNNNGKLVRDKLEKNPTVTSLRLQPNTIIGASDEIETELLHLWANILNISDKDFKYSVDDNFYYLGGTSIQAANLIANINSKFPLLKLTPTIFYRNPTISSIARKIRRQETRSTLKPHSPEYYYPVIAIAEERFPLKQHQNNKPIPLFVIHDLLGSHERFCQLLENWASKRPVYGLVARGLKNPKDMDNILEDIAIDYLQAIIRVQPEGPYLLAGWSTGGVIAAVIAHYLKLRGEQVAVLALDSTHPNVLQKMSGKQFAYTLFDIFEKAILPRLDIRDITFTKDDLCILPQAEQISKFIETCNNQSKLEKNRISPLTSCVHSLLFALIRFNLQLNEEDIQIFKTKSSQEKFGDTLGWSNTCKFKLIEGDHFNIFSSELAKKIIYFADESEKSLIAMKYNKEQPSELDTQSMQNSTETNTPTNTPNLALIVAHQRIKIGKFSVTKLINANIAIVGEQPLSSDTMQGIERLGLLANPAGSRPPKLTPFISAPEIEIDELVEHAQINTHLYIENTSKRLNRK